MAERFHKLPNLAGNRISRRVRSDRVVDELGNTFGSEESIEVSETFDGVEEQREHVVRQLLACGHVHEVGAPLVKCDSCSAKAGRPAFVCESCAVTSPLSGQGICVRCSIMAPDCRRYSPKDFKRAKKMGLFDKPQNFSICTPSRGGLLTRSIAWVMERW